MSREKINGILGIWVVLLAFLGFSDSLKRFLMVITGITIAFVAFYSKSLIKPTKDLMKDSEKLEEEIKTYEEKEAPASVIMPEEEKKEELDQTTSPQTQDSELPQVPPKNIQQ